MIPAALPVIPGAPGLPGTPEHGSPARSRARDTESATDAGSGPALAAATGSFALQLAAFLGAAPTGPKPVATPAPSLGTRAERQPVAPEAARSLLARPGSGFRLPEGPGIPLILLPTRDTGSIRTLLFRLPENALLDPGQARSQARELGQAPVRVRITGRGTPVLPGLDPAGQRQRPAADPGFGAVSPLGATDTGIREEGRFRSLVSQAGEARSEVRDLRSLLETLSGQIRFLVEEGSGKGESLIRLKPPELGVVKLNLVQHGESISVRIQVEHAAPRQLIESRLGELQESLVGAGIRVDKLEVVDAGRGGSPPDPGEERDPGSPGHGRKEGQQPDRRDQRPPGSDRDLETGLREIGFRERLQAGLARGGEDTARL